MKTKKIKVRQGFTIVELVIVIGVIGVLTAVLVPTFINLNQKANQAADESLVKNLNTQLAIKKQSEGANKTMSEALSDALEAGYKVENLTPKGNKDIVWNQETDEFAQLEAAPAENAYKFWKIYEKAEDIPSAQTYSIYAKGNAWTTVPTLSVGFDAGENTEIASLNFETEATREVSIRTHGTRTALTVNAKNATVNHYDVLNTLTVNAIAGESYHEWGTINGKAVISAGHIEIEQGASVSQVAVENATSAVKVTANESTAVFVSSDSTEKTSVVANSDGVYVAGAKEGSISGKKAEDVKKPVMVTSEAELAQATSAKEKFIQLGDSFSISSHVMLKNPELVLDLNGHTITGPADSYGLVVSDETTNVMLTDSVGTGKITANYPVWVQSKANVTVSGGSYIGTACGLRAIANAKVTINGGTFEANGSEGIINNYSSIVMNDGLVRNSTWGVTVYGNGSSASASFVMNGGKISGSSFGISGNGTAKFSGTAIEIHGGEIESTGEGGAAVYHPQNGSFRIDGNPVFKGASSLYIKSGTTSINGGKFIATLAEKAPYNFSGNGADATGDAIVVDACNYPGGNPCVEAQIKGATFELADSTAKKVAYYSHDNGAAVVVVDGKTLDPVIG